MENEWIRHIEILAGSIGVIISLLWGVLLTQSNKGQLKINIFLAIFLWAFGLKIGKTLFLNYFKIAPVILNLFLGLLLIVGPSMLIYTKLLLNSNKNIQPKLYFHYLPALIFMSFCWIIPNDGSNLAGHIHSLLYLHLLVYTIFSLYCTAKQKIANPSSRQTAVIKWLTYLGRLTLMLTLLFFLVIKNIIPYYIGTALFYSAFVLLLITKAVKHLEVFQKEKEKYSNSNLTNTEIEKYFSQVMPLMEEKKPYLNPNITLSNLAKTIGLSPKKLSQVINQKRNQNYSQFITQLRIEEAKQQLEDPNNQFKISAIAYDSGFNSISSFNNAFKKHTNLTASQYRKSFKNNKQ